MNELIKILKTQLNGVEINSVNARDLHEYLESKRQFADWIKDRLEYVYAVENADYIIVSQNCETLLEGGGRRISIAKEYIITLDLAREFSMLERNAKGKEARRYFIECEKRLNNQKPLSIPEIIQIQAGYMIEQDKKIKAVEDKAKDLKKETLRLSSNLNRVLTNDKYMTVIAYANLKGIKANSYNPSSLGKRATRLSHEAGAQMGAVIDSRFGRVKTYSVEILNEAFNGIKQNPFLSLDELQRG